MGRPLISSGMPLRIIGAEHRQERRIVPGRAGCRTDEYLEVRIHDGLYASRVTLTARWCPVISGGY